MKRWFATLIVLGLMCCVATPLLAQGKGRKGPGMAKGREGANQQQAMVMKQLMQRFDTNSNGQLDGDERRAMLTACDQNLDGRLSPQELMAAAVGDAGQGKKLRGKEGAGKEAGKKKN